MNIGQFLLDRVSFIGGLCGYVAFADMVWAKLKRRRMR